MSNAELCDEVFHLLTMPPPSILPLTLRPKLQYNHPHYHENTKAVINRMNRAIGHMNSIKTMVEHGRDCGEILVQIAAVRSAINNIGKIILEDHIDHCILDAIKEGDDAKIEELHEIIEKYVK